MRGIEVKKAEHGVVLVATRTMYPTLLQVVGEKQEVGNEISSLYGYVLAPEGGGATIALSEGGIVATLGDGCFFALPGRVGIDPLAGALVIVIQRHGFRCLPTMGQREEQGRLSYIDGCSDSMLVLPPRKGDPVWNHLHFPAGINQSQHTHPSIRMGIVAGGGGHAYATYRKADGSIDQERSWEKALEPGNVFLLPEQELHSFRTDKSGTPMDVIAYHPDSDWGPTDDNHPMLNRTYLANQPAGQLAVGE